MVDYLTGQGWQTVIGVQDRLDGGWPYNRSEPRPLMVYRPPSLEEAQALVDGYVEMAADFFHTHKRIKCQVLVNEEGLLRRMGINLAATEWLRRHHKLWGERPPLVGTAILLTGDACW